MLPETATLLYENPLASSRDVEDFKMEGDANISFLHERMHLSNMRDPSDGQKSNFVFWCPEIFPSNLAITWKFWPIKEPGLSMLFFAAKGHKDTDLFDPQLTKRTGEYHQYHSGDIDTFHIAYFRRRHPSERAFHICNLRKSYGAHMVAQGADPIPNVEDADNPYNMLLVKHQKEISFFINDYLILRWQDDGETYGPLFQEGRIGFRQMAPLVAAYSNLNVYAL